jgi:hypothetical protein
MPRRRFGLAEFVRAEPCADGETLELTLLDQEGEVLVLSLPLPCLGELLAGLPAGADPPAGQARDVKSWRIEPAAMGLRLVLLTADGQTAAFHISRGQIAAMATLTAYGGLGARDRRLMN